ncbi:MAG: winged helix-turn-helix transcriptional regulator [Synergistaceae bacterium]|nr:winged helix-turn-helix transcriptional regulator [Synergistaceae bacterium]
MVNELQVFVYGSEPVRTIEIDGENWLVAKDVCNILEIVDYHQAVERLDDDERGRYKVPTPGGIQEMTVINESGLYKLTFRSNKPEAKKFTKWVTSEVLPTLRKTGSFNIGYHRKRMADFDRAMKQGKEVYTSMGYRGKKLGVALDKIYKDYLGFSALELAGIDPNDTSPEEDQVLLSTWKRRVLDYLKEHESVTPKELSHATGISCNTARSHLMRLERQGYLRKVSYGVYVLDE